MKKTKASLMLPDGTDWDWDAVTTDLVAWIVNGGSRTRFANQKHTPSMIKLHEFIGDYEERAARIGNAYRFRAEGRIDEVMEARAEMRNGDLTPQQFQQLQNGLMQEVRMLTNMATTPNKSEPIKATVNDQDLVTRIERAQAVRDHDEESEGAT